MTSWSVSIVLTTPQIIAVVILEFLLEWQSVEFASQGKLAVDFFLADVEVFHVEEACYMSVSTMRKVLACFVLTNMSNGMVQLLDKFFFPSWLFV